MLDLTSRSCGLIGLFLVAVALTSIISNANLSDARAKGYRAPLNRLPTQDDGWTALKTDDGVLFIWNRPGLSFTLSIKGHEIRPMDSGENIFFMVDGLVLQIQSLPISNFAPDAKKNKPDDKSILIAHRNWESKFLEESLLHNKLTIQSANEKLANGTEVLVWQFDLPEGLKNGDAQKQIYVTVVAKDYVILLNGVVNETASEAKVRSFLLDKISTLKISPGRFDVKKLQEAIRKGAP